MNLGLESLESCFWGLGIKIFGLGVKTALEIRRGSRKSLVRNSPVAPAPRRSLRSAAALPCAQRTPVPHASAPARTIRAQRIQPGSHRPSGIQLHRSHAGVRIPWCHRNDPWLLAQDRGPQEGIRPGTSQHQEGR